MVLDASSGNQKFYGGGVVDYKAKNISVDDEAHTDDILSITVCGDMVATGQVGPSPVIHVWSASNLQKKVNIKLPKGSRGIRALEFSNDGKYLAAVDMSNNHNVYCYDASSGALVFSQSGDTNEIFDVAFDKRPGQYTFVTVGVKHHYFWNPDTKDKQKGLLMQKGDITTHTCATYTDNGLAFTGAVNSQIFVWEGRECQGTISIHKGGSVSALKAVGSNLLSGGKDGFIHVYDTNSKATTNSIQVGNLVRGIDIDSSGTIFYGLRNGEICMNSNGQRTQLMQSHFEGEVWGLAIVDQNSFVTSGDDNKIFAWTSGKNLPTASGTVSNESRKARRGGASTLSKLPDSQCSRALAYNPSNGHLAVGHNDGTLTIRASLSSLDSIVATKNDSKEWIECMAYSPDGSKLAVGSHDNNIYVYDSSSYNLVGTCKAHNSFIVSVDWSEDG